MNEFGWESTADDVLQAQDLTGKRVLVTGVSAGLGVETARALAARGAEVIGTARDLDKARCATEGFAAQLGERFGLVELDLASLDSVRACDDALLAEGKMFDLLIANAGIMAVPFEHTKDGFESQMGVNHLSHFVLINRLAPLIREGGRVVCLSSVGHHWGETDLVDMNFEARSYEPVRAYGDSKTAIILFALEFDRRHKARGVRACSVHPGGIVTELARYMTEDAIAKMTEMTMAEAGGKAEDIRFKTVEQGAATSVWAAATAAANAIGGQYCEDCQVSPVTEVGALGVRPYALDPERARALWAKSEELVGERFE
ncbi:MAG: SDR family NAD(P)-dependent oxidoreductase [Novosphingobium sp.]|nr:SDR family NAD(P)-dependent oxidoreductase [Novosphingobium sp.]